MAKFILGRDDEDKTRVCRNCGIYYKVMDSSNHRIRLFTLGYSKKLNDFILIPKVNLPKELILRYDGVMLDEQIRQELTDLGIHSYKSVKYILDRYAYYRYLVQYENYLSSPSIDEANNVYTNLVNLQQSIGDYEKSSIKK